MIEGSGSRAGSGSIPLTNGSGFGMPKNTWIRNTGYPGPILVCCAGDVLETVLWIRIRIRIRSDPELFEGSGSGSGINSFGSGSFLIPNFCVKKSHFFNQIAQKIGKFSTYIYVHIKYVFIYM
jgi:hypothetical protein